MSDDQFWADWLDICDRRDRHGFSTLSPPERTFFAMNFVVGTVERGGFHPYFDMASHEEVESAKLGFAGCGGEEIAELLRQAEAVLFPSGVPHDPATQAQELPSWTDDEIERSQDPPWVALLENLNVRFRAQSDRAYEIVAKFYQDNVLSAEG